MPFLFYLFVSACSPYPSKGYGINEMKIVNANMDYQTCLKDTPVVNKIAQCDDPNTCAAIWLAEVKTAKQYKTSCMVQFGGSDLQYYYE